MICYNLREWLAEVIRLANRRCAICNQSFKRMQAHHIIPRSVGALDTDNGVCLCLRHHKNMHVAPDNPKIRMWYARLLDIYNARVSSKPIEITTIGGRMTLTETYWDHAIKKALAENANRKVGIVSASELADILDVQNHKTAKDRFYEELLEQKEALEAE